MRLIFKGDGGISNFTQALDEVVTEGPIAVATPYLNPEYLAYLVESKEWRLLTDLDECLVNMNIKERAQFQRLFTDNKDKMRDYPLLHAKVVVGRRKAFLGSANITRHGLGKRQEAAVLLSDQRSVEELLVWFDGLWERAEELSIEKLKTRLTRLPQNREINRQANSSRSRTIDSECTIPWKRKLKYTRTDIPEIVRRKHLVEAIARAPSRNWIEQYFELLERAIRASGLDNDDRRILTSCTQDKQINLTINRCYALTSFRKRNSIGMILPQNCQVSQYQGINVLRYKPGDPFKLFTRKKGNDPYIYVEFTAKGDDLSTIPEDMVNSWLSAVSVQSGGWDESLYRKYHEPLVYRAAVDMRFRKRLIDEAFGGRS
jgi:hypothetical protein